MHLFPSSSLLFFFFFFTSSLSIPRPPPFYFFLIINTHTRFWKKKKSIEKKKIKANEKRETKKKNISLCVCVDDQGWSHLFQSFFFLSFFFSIVFTDQQKKKKRKQKQREGHVGSFCLNLSSIHTGDALLSSLLSFKILRGYILIDSKEEKSRSVKSVVVMGVFFFCWPNLIRWAMRKEDKALSSRLIWWSSLLDHINSSDPSLSSSPVSDSFFFFFLKPMVHLLYFLYLHLQTQNTHLHASPLPPKNKKQNNSYSTYSSGWSSLSPNDDSRFGKIGERS